MFALLLLAVSIQSDFEGGSIGKVEYVSEDLIRCAVAGEVDQDKRNRQASWYYFRVDGAAGRSLTVELVDLPGEYNYRPNRGAITKDTIPVYSEDDVHWQHFDASAVEYDESEPVLRLRFTPKSNRFWIAHVPPYTNMHLRSLLRSFAGHPHARVESVGRTVRGREIPLLTITDPSAPDDPKRVVWLMFRQHSWESGSSWVGEGAIRYLLSEDPEAWQIRKSTIFKILPMCDPDGVARGGVRFNVHGYDLNRNWDVRDEKLMPEIAAERKAVLDWVRSGRKVNLLLQAIVGGYDT